MKMQICKLSFSILLIILFSVNVIAEDFIVNVGEGDVNVVLDKDYVVEDGKIVPLEDSEKQIDDSLNIKPDKSEINSEEQSSQEKSAMVTGAVIGSNKPNNYIIPILIALVVIVGLSIFFVKIKRKRLR